MPAAFTVRLDEATLGALDRLAEKTDRSRSWLVTKAIEDYVAQNFVDPNAADPPQGERK